MALSIHGTATWVVIVRIAGEITIVTPLWESELSYDDAMNFGIECGLRADKAEFTVEVFVGTRN